MTELSTLQRTVIQSGYCIGCGACAAVEKSLLQINLNLRGQYEAVINSAGQNELQDEEIESQMLAVCPFSGSGPNEDDIARKLFAPEAEYHPLIGFRLSTYAGHIAEGDYRQNGSSGGMTSWVLCELMRHGLIDAAIHVKPNIRKSGETPLFRMDVSRSKQEIKQGAKSRYYPVEMSQVLREIQRVPGRYAVVGLPCFIKAIRLLGLVDARIKERMVYCIGLVCGHLKSSRFADMLAWQMEIAPGNLISIDFRQKIAGQPANRYGINAISQNEGKTFESTRLNNELYGYNWGYGFFKYNACDYCDDVFGETADISIGDAWLPKYVGDSGGTNIVITRQKQLDSIVYEAISAGRLLLEPIDADRVVQSQDAGIRHRREGLAYRLYLKDQTGAWRPPKRVKARVSHLDHRQRKIQNLRMQLASESHEAFQKAMAAGRYEVFRQAMDPLVRKYTHLYVKPLWRRVAGKFRRTLCDILFVRRK